MMNSSGVDHFNENKRLFCDPKAAPEKYNLYGGLAAMAAHLQQLGERVNDLGKGLEHISKQLDGLRGLLAKRT